MELQIFLPSVSSLQAIPGNAHHSSSLKLTTSFSFIHVCVFEDRQTLLMTPQFYPIHSL